MAKGLSVNCGTALLLRENYDVFNGFDDISINTGSAVVSAKVQAKLNELGVTINSGSVEYIDTKGKVVELGDGRLDSDSDYSGCFLLIQGNLLMVKKDENALRSADGMLLLGKLYYPDSISIGAFPHIKAKKYIKYPDGAVIERNDIKLTEDYVSKLPDSSLVWIDGSVDILDEAAVNLAVKKSITIQAKHIFATKSLSEQYNGLSQADKKTIVPDMHVITDGLTLDSLTEAVYGDRIYVRGNFCVNLSDIKYLSGMKSIIVEGCASLPVSCIGQFRQIGIYGELFAYEGDLLNNDSVETFSHARLTAAMELGIVYTIKNSGSMTFTDDVTPQDLECVATVYNDGCIEILGALMPAFMRRVKKNNGAIDDTSLPQKAEVDETEVKTQGNVAINTGMFRL